ncbi:hypothetical protein N7448_011331 [Penicillium atrosanguineum]|nr:hypothetical protein N7448_011331 [Penicillium atrosanguineum]
MDPVQPSQELVVVRREETEVPLSQLRAEKPRLGKLSAGIIVVCQDEVNPSNFKVLLIRRPYTDSFPGTSECPHGKSDEGDKTIMNTALRETKEEIDLKISPETFLPFGYRRTFWYRETWMTSYHLIAVIRGTFQVKLSKEHIEEGFFDEKMVKEFGLFDPNKTERGQPVMLDSMKKMLCHFFANRKNLMKGDIDAIVPMEN